MSRIVHFFQTHLQNIGSTYRTLAPTIFILVFATGLALAIHTGVLPVEAQTTDTSSNASAAAVQAQIDANNSQIAATQAEIAAYQKQLDAISSQKQTLQSSLKSIDLTREKTAAQISAIQDEIAAADANLQKLSSTITAKQAEIDSDKNTLAASLRQINTADQTPLLATLFSTDNFLDAWKEIDAEIQLGEALDNQVQSLSSDTQQLTGQQQQVSSTKDVLSTDNVSLVTQKGSLDATAQAKSQLIAQTSSKQQSYQALIAQKKAEEASFESALNSLQNSLKSISSSQVPKSGAGILSWPVSDAEMQHCASIAADLGNPYCITQYFGNTPFATANAAIYSGMGHDGVDIGVPIGTPVQAALDGVVAGTGDTDLVHDAEGDQCYSFGKWIMLEHSNGLNTMYAHLSVIGVTKGQTVTTGQVIGYSGMTGYATGPHIHFGVYATAGVKYMTLGAFHGTQTPCSGATMPVAPPSAYLNPLSYLL